MSSGSGIKIDDEIKGAYSKIHNKKGQYAILMFNDDQNGLKIVEEGGEKSYNDVISGLPNDDVRYIFFDFPFITKQSDQKNTKVLCISWHPQSSSVKKRMLCASTFSALKHACKIGANESLEGDDASDIDVDTILKKIGGKATY